jgi:glycine cleavage system H lipoate-binding protein
MTNKVYKSAMGKTVDIGALILQNEQVRAVGNMGVNASGDVVDSNNQVIDQRNQKVQRQYNRQINSNPPTASKK